MISQKLLKWFGAAHYWGESALELISIIIPKQNEINYSVLCGEGREGVRFGHSRCATVLDDEKDTEDGSELRLALQASIINEKFVFKFLMSESGNSTPFGYLNQSLVSLLIVFLLFCVSDMAFVIKHTEKNFN